MGSPSKSPGKITKRHRAVIQGFQIRERDLLEAFDLPLAFVEADQRRKREFPRFSVLTGCFSEFLDRPGLIEHVVYHLEHESDRVSESVQSRQIRSRGEGADAA